MEHTDWAWAELNGSQLEMLRAAEETLGADILLAYQQSGFDRVQSEKLSTTNLQVANLDDSQVECLQGLEQKMQAVVIAYQES